MLVIFGIQPFDKTLIGFGESSQYHCVVYNPMSHRGMGGGGLLEQVKSSELQ